MGEPSFLGIKLIDIAIFILWSLICYSVGEFMGRSMEEREEVNEDV